MREAVDGKVAPYEELAEPKVLKKFMEERLEDYNMEPGVQAMNLVMFGDAIANVCRIKRVLSMPRGNAMLVGVGGSGRQSLTRLASYIAGIKIFMIEVVRGYRSELFREDLKKLYERAGMNDEPTTFLFNDTQVIESSFLEDINGMLTSGEVSNLYARRRAGPGLREAMRPDARAAQLAETNDVLWGLFIERVRANMHIVLCMSPIGDSYRNYVRMFPALVSCTTINWFSEWPADALKEVAAKFLEARRSTSPTCRQRRDHLRADADLGARRVARRCSNAARPAQLRDADQLPRARQGLRQAARREARHHRRPGEQAQERPAEALRHGEQVGEMSVELEQKKKVVAKAQADTEELLVVIVQENHIVAEQQKAVNIEQEKIAKDEVETRKIADDAQQDLDKALPALEMAQKALEQLNKKDMAEVKAYAKPHKAVEKVMEAVMILRKSEPSWAEAKKQLGDPSSSTQLVTLRQGLAQRRDAQQDQQVHQGRRLRPRDRRRRLQGRQVALHVGARDGGLRPHRQGRGAQARQAAAGDEDTREEAKGARQRAGQGQGDHRQGAGAAGEVRRVDGGQGQAQGRVGAAREEARARRQPRRRPRRRARALGGDRGGARGEDEQPGGRLPARGGLPLVLRPLRLRLPPEAAQRPRGSRVSRRSTSRARPTSTSASSSPTRRTCATGTSRGCPPTPSRPRTASWSRAARAGR